MFSIFDIHDLIDRYVKIAFFENRQKITKNVKKCQKWPFLKNTKVRVARTENAQKGDLRHLLFFDLSVKKSLIYRRFFGHF